MMRSDQDDTHHIPRQNLPLSAKHTQSQVYSYSATTPHSSQLSAQRKLLYAGFGSGCSSVLQCFVSLLLLVLVSYHAFRVCSV